MTGHTADTSKVKLLRALATGERGMDTETNDALWWAVTQLERGNGRG